MSSDGVAERQNGNVYRTTSQVDAKFTSTISRFCPSDCASGSKWPDGPNSVRGRTSGDASVVRSLAKGLIVPTSDERIETLLIVFGRPRPVCLCEPTRTANVGNPAFVYCLVPLLHAESPTNMFGSHRSLLRLLGFDSSSPYVPIDSISCTS